MLLLIRNIKGNTMELKITKIGNSLGVILPKEFTAHMDIDKGDSVWISKTPNGCNIEAYDDEFARQMKLAREIMKKRRHVLRELAQ
jgi:putative addiction module antidote